MEVINTLLQDCFVLKHSLHSDDRGFFMEAFNWHSIENKLGVSFEVKQINFAKSDKDVLRGLHYQLNPSAQAKLVGVVHGTVLDVVVDLRPSSSSYKQKFEYLLDSPEKGLFVPRGFAHGYEVLEDGTLFYYAVDNFYSPKDERGLRYDDPELGITWKRGSKNKISKKDLDHPSLVDIETNFE